MESYTVLRAACSAEPTTVGGTATDEAARVLSLIRAATSGPEVKPAAYRSTGAECAVLTWARWGAMAMTGPPDGPPLAPQAPIATRVSGLVHAVRALTGLWREPVTIDPAAVLCARAAEQGWSRRGAMSVNGSARLLPAADGWLAVNLARPYDVEVLPAVLGGAVPASDAWPAVAEWAGSRPASAAEAALQLVGIPAAALAAHAHLAPLTVTRHGDRAPASGRAPRVIDLSAMWAGPLAAYVLGRAGAEVVKVEDVNRLDGAKNGPARFYDQLHAGHHSVMLDFTTPGGRDDLRELIDSADIVIEASRPRALRRLGVVAEEFLAARAGRTWLSITGYGRDAYEGERVAFGDDAAVAGGLVALDGRAAPVFCADAIADPLSGLWASAAVVASQLAGGGHLAATSMAGVCSDAVRPTPEVAWHQHRIECTRGRWSVRHEDGSPQDVAQTRLGAFA